jgi:hypothetical protein
MSEELEQEDNSDIAFLKAMNDTFPVPDDDSIPDDTPFDFAEDKPDDVKPDDTKPDDTIEDEKPLIDEADDFLGLSEDEKPDGFSEKSFDEETEELSKGMDAKAGLKFKALRQELKEYKQKQVEVKVPDDVAAKIQELELKASEAEGLRQQVEELSNVSAKVKVESSREYKQRVLEPAVTILQESAKIAEAHDVDPEVVQDIIREQDREMQIDLINANLSNLNELEKQDLYRMIYEYRNLGKIRQDMLDNAEQKLSQIEAEQIQQQQIQLEQDKKAVQQIQSSIWDKYKTVIPGFTNEDGEPTEEWTKLRNRSLSIDFNKAAGKDKAYAAFAGVALPHVIKELNNAKKMLQELTGKEANEILRRPKLGQPLPKAEEPEDFISAMRKIKF